MLGNSDFTQQETQDNIKELLNNRKADVVISDMAPSATGIKEMDDENILKLCYSALRFAILVSNENATVLMKLWQTSDGKKLEESIKRFYGTLNIIKPPASHTDSAEIFLLGRNFKGLKS